MIQRLRRARHYIKGQLFKFISLSPNLLSSRLGSIITQTNWKDIEYFDEAWKTRIQFMATYIPAGASVLDLGCGKEWLKDIVGAGRYTGVDYAKRSMDTIVCDFNRREFPRVTKDVAFVSGCLEYIADPDWFIGAITRICKRCILSYCPIDTHGYILDRRRYGWVNDLSIHQIEEMFSKHGFRLSVTTVTPTNNAILVFEKTPLPQRALHNSRITPKDTLVT